MPKRVMQIIMAVLGAILVLRYSLPGILWGVRSVIPLGPVDATLDSHWRFFSALVGGVGLIIVLMIPVVEKYRAIFYLILMAAFVGGLARILSMVHYGLPSAEALTALILEVTLPVVLFLLKRTWDQEPAPASR